LGISEANGHSCNSDIQRWKKTPPWDLVSTSNSSSQLSHCISFVYWVIYYQLFHFGSYVANWDFVKKKLGYLWLLVDFTIEPHSTSLLSIFLLNHHCRISFPSLTLITLVSFHLILRPHLQPKTSILYWYVSMARLNTKLDLESSKRVLQKV